LEPLQHKGTCVIESGDDFLPEIRCLLASIVIIAVCMSLKVPLISRFPLEIGAILYVSLHLIWRPLYLNAGILSDPPFQVMTF
jgi:hypothetical protein